MFRNSLNYFPPYVYLHMGPALCIFAPQGEDQNVASPPLKLRKVLKGIRLKGGSRRDLGLYND